jgi:hypothetical protein
MLSPVSPTGVLSKRSIIYNIALSPASPTGVLSKRSIVSPRPGNQRNLIIHTFKSRVQTVLTNNPDPKQQMKEL